jgi:hypothetical protein
MAWQNQLDYDCKLLASRSVRFRVDDRKQRLIVDGSSDAGLAVMGWEVPTRAELDRLAGRLDDHGVKVTRGSARWRTSGTWPS